MPNLAAKHKVLLSAAERAEFAALCRRQTVGAAQRRRARILLLSDENHPEGRRSDGEIADLVELSERQVVRIRQRFVREGAAALDRQPLPPRERKLDGAAEAHLVTLCCSTPPEGRARWTLQLLCDELARLQVVTSVCRETVRQALKKTSSSRGTRNGSASPNPTGRGSSRGWRKSSTSISNRTTKRSR